MSAPNRLVIFDCDGTMVDTQHIIVECMDAAFRTHKLAPPTADQARRVVGLSLIEAVQILMPGQDITRVQEVAKTFGQNFIANRDTDGYHEPLYPGLKEILLHLDGAEILMGVATGKARRGLDHTLASHDIAHHFVTLQTADRHPSKPHPSMVEAAMAEAGAEPHTTLVIGDTSYDMDMAKAAGAHAVGVNWGYHDDHELIDAGAHSVLHEFPALIPVLKELL